MIFCVFSWSLIFFFLLFRQPVFFFYIEFLKTSPFRKGHSKKRKRKIKLTRFDSKTIPFAFYSRALLRSFCSSSSKTLNLRIRHASEDENPSHHFYQIRMRALMTPMTSTPMTLHAIWSRWRQYFFTSLPSYFLHPWNTIEIRYFTKLDTFLGNPFFW